MALDQVVHVREVEDPSRGEPTPTEVSRVGGTVGRKLPPGLPERLLVILEPALDVVETEHVVERPAGSCEIRVGPRAEVAETKGKRPAARPDRPQVLLEGRTLASVPRRLGKDDSLAHDRIALRLLHARIRAHATRVGP